MSPKEILETERAKHPHLTRREWYREIYLNSDHWKTLRELAFKAHGRRCERCRKSFQIDVHHLTYRNIFDVTAADLQVLCRRCHGKTHKHNLHTFDDPVRITCLKKFGIPDEIVAMIRVNLRGRRQSPANIYAAIDRTIEELNDSGKLSPQLHADLFACRRGKRAMRVHSLQNPK